MKRLITAAVVRQERQAGTKRLEVCVSDCIVTPEARTVAEQLGLEIVQTVGLPATCAKKAAKPAALACSDLAAIRSAIMAKLPAGSVPQELVDQLVKKAVCEKNAPVETGPSGDGSYVSQKTKSGIKGISGASIKMGLFEGAGKENRVGLVDVVTAEDRSSMAGGFMEWSNCFFPWTLKYDEIDYIIEGELHIRCNGETTIGKAGDVIFIPKNSSIEFGTPTSVKFMYVAYPVNWAEQ